MLADHVAVNDAAMPDECRMNGSHHLK